MTSRLLATLAVAIFGLATTFSPALAAPSHASVSLTGAGSSFDYPFFTKAFAVYSSKHPVSVNYQPIGSGAGIAAFIAKTVDFGASDVPMSGPDLANAEKAGGAVEQVPVALGGVSIAYNLPGMKSGLRFSGSVLADIYLGKITKWNDPAITKLNKGKKLPDMPIAVVHRSDSSGTSYIFTDYLSHVSKDWATKYGANKLPNWPVGLGGQKNSGVAGIIQQTKGAIGYVEFAYVKQNHMTQALVENKAHRFMYPDIANVRTAAAQFKKVSAMHFSIVNAGGKNSYPICGYSWVLLYKKQADKTKGTALVNLMQWTVTAGQKYAADIDYVALPKAVQNLAKSDLNSVKA